MNTLTPLIESILFAATEPVGAEQLSAFFGVDEEEILEELTALQKFHDSPNRGFRLIRHENEFRFATKPEFGADTALFLAKKRPQLSNAAMETLAVAAYNQPVTKPYISQIRGVASAEIVETLEEKGLLKEAGRLDLPGRPMSYVTTDKFLTVFGLDSLADLPPLNPEEETTADISEPSDRTADEESNSSATPPDGTGVST